MITLKRESKLLFMKAKSRIHEHADTHTGKVLFQREKYKALIIDTERGKIVPKQWESQQFISLPVHFRLVRGPDVCSPCPVSLKVIMHSLSILWPFLISQSLSFPKTLSLHPLTFSCDLRPWFKAQMYVLMLMVHLPFSFSISWTSVTDCPGMGLSVLWPPGQGGNPLNVKKTGTVNMVMGYRGKTLM